jgi:NADPH:quinone reductase-like Zn-dependent oxidoreductase
MKAWQIVSDGGIDALHLADIPTPEPDPGEVRVRLAASSLNYRDLMTVKDPGGRNLPYPRVPNSDGAGTITAVGAGVTGWREGDQVASCFFRAWSDGMITQAAMDSALGGALDGVLSEEVILSADGVVAMPKGYSAAEAATLPCAALTAWHALFEVNPIKAGDRVLLLGTGGVSIFALQFAVAAGAEVFITSSSDDKLARAKAMGAHHLINYKTTPDWDQAVQALTAGVGVDVTVEVGGPGTVSRSVEATRVGGTVGMIGVLSQGDFNPARVMRKSIHLQGIYVGSRRMFEDMNRAIEHHAIKPVLDQQFAFDAAPAAFHAMESQQHFGKIVLQV